MIEADTSVTLSLVTCDGFSRPAVDAAEFDDIRIAEGGQLVRRLLAAVAAAAIDENQLFPVGQLLGCCVAYRLIGHVDGTGDMPLGILRGCAHIQHNVNRIEPSTATVTLFTMLNQSML